MEDCTGISKAPRIQQFLREAVSGYRHTYGPSKDRAVTDHGTLQHPVVRQVLARWPSGQFLLRPRSQEIAACVSAKFLTQQQSLDDIAIKRFVFYASQQFGD